MMTAGSTAAGFGGFRRARVRPSLSRALIFAFGAGAAGCDRDDPSTAWAGAVVDSAGVVIVTSPEEGLWSGAESWTVTEELRVGDLGTDPRYQFAQVGSIALTSAGNILVMDRQARELREFTAQGDFVRTIGSPGQGPGEFGPGASDVFATAGDTLLIPDVRKRLIHRFDPGGIFLDTAPLSTEAFRPLKFQWNPATGVAVAQLRPARRLLKK